MKELNLYILIYGKSDDKGRYILLFFSAKCHGYHMIYLMQVIGGDPLLKLIAVDWLKVDKSIDRIALHHRSLVQVKLIL